MCGLVFSFSNKTFCNKDKFTGALNALKVRGPDSIGSWYSDDHKIAPRSYALSD